MGSGEILRRYVHKSKEMLLDVLFPRTRSQRALAALSVKTLVALKNPSALPSGDDIISLFPYAHPSIKALIWELKYRGDQGATEKCAAALYESITEELSVRNSGKTFADALLMPIPLSKKRLAQRGFNQCELLVEKISRMDNGKHFTVRTDVFCKIRDTKSQTKTQGKKERQKNLRGCFLVNDAAVVKNRNILLIDDVVTTGSTLLEAKKTLLEAGATKVICFAVAH